MIPLIKVTFEHGGVITQRVEELVDCEGDCCNFGEEVKSRIQASFKMSELVSEFSGISEQSFF